jgi:CDP-glucose 4,6-dehydratase
VGDARSTVENLVMTRDFWRGRKVLLTGHTGFKGAWLSLWLHERGARTTGLALAPESRPNLFDLARVEDTLESNNIIDINDRKQLDQVIAACQPEVVLHLAAQSLVRRSYHRPVETFATNTLGVCNLLDAVRAAPSVRAVVVVTTDKCYENREWVWGYRETDAMGGHDPYSASKGAAEIVTASMRRSYFAPYAASGHPARIASARAGNVIGGGDFSEDRLIPDIVGGCLAGDGQVVLRNPTAVRPWQHVLDPLSGYLRLAEALVADTHGADSGWNFGPDTGDDRAVEEVARAIVAAIGNGRLILRPEADAPHEAHTLRLDCSKAHRELGWRPALPFRDAVSLTADWYKQWHAGADMRTATVRQIHAYEDRRREMEGVA